MNVTLDLVLAGALETLTLWNVALISAGVAVGMLVGAVPGLNGPMAIAIAVPITFHLQPIGALGLLIGIMKGGTIGGAVPAILMNTPGTPEAFMTTLDGYPMTRKGQSGKAMKMALYSSVTGDAFSDLALFVAAVPLAVAAALMGPVEQAAVVFFAICVLAALVGGNPLRGLVVAAFGFVLAAVGQSPEEATPRLTFGFPELEDGIPLVAIGMGVLVLGEIVHAVANGAGSGDGRLAPESTGPNARLTLREYLSCRRTIFRSAVIGTAIGATPGIGSALAATVGYSAARRAAARPEEFGKGTVEGVAAAEAANSSVSGANLIPLLTLGVPGNVAAAFLMGALIIHGVVPGPTLFRDETQLVFAIFTAMVVANVCNLTIGRLGLALFAPVARLKAVYVYPAVILVCFAGVYASGAGHVGLFMLCAFGAIGYLLRVMNFSVVIFIIAFVLGRIWEFPLTQAIILTDGDPANLANHPIAAGFVAAGVALVLFALARPRKNPSLPEDRA